VDLNTRGLLTLLFDDLTLVMGWAMADNMRGFGRFPENRRDIGPLWHVIAHGQRQLGGLGG